MDSLGVKDVAKASLAAVDISRSMIDAQVAALNGVTQQVEELFPRGLRKVQIIEGVEGILMEDTLGQMIEVQKATLRLFLGLRS